MDDEYLTAAEVGERLGLSLRTVRRRIADGSIASVRFGRAVRVPAAGIVATAQPRQIGVQETAAAYGTDSSESREERWNATHWPDTHARLLGRRRQAFGDLATLRASMRPSSGPGDSVDTMLNQVRDQFGERLLSFIPLPESREG